jgi:hypothetical protein
MSPVRTLIRTARCVGIGPSAIAAASNGDAKTSRVASSVPSGETYAISTITGSAVGAMRASSSSSRRVSFLLIMVIAFTQPGSYPNRLHCLRLGSSA